VLTAADGQIVAWAALALVNAVTIYRMLPKVPPHGLGLRLLRYAYDAGQLLAAGIVSAAAVAAWTRWGPRRRVLGDLAIAAAGIGLGLYVLPFDLGGASNKLTVLGSQVITLHLLVIAAGIAIAIAARVGSLFSRAELRYAGAGLALAIGIMDERVLLNDYPSVHLYIAWSAAVLGGATLTGLRLPFFRAGASPLRSRGSLPPGFPGMPVRAAIAGFAAWAVLVPPRFSLGRQLFDAPGAVIAPLLAHLRMSATRNVYPPAEKRPDVPASTPSLLPPNPVVLFFVIDALRADVVANERLDAQLPNIAKLRRESVDFTKARSPASGTIWTLASMFSSRYYSELFWKPRPGGSETLSYPYLDKSVRFPEILKGAGVATFSSTQMPDVENAIGDCGVLRGFSAERLIPPSRPASGGAVTDAAVSELRRSRNGPMFLYVHYLETHSPYMAGKPTDSPYAKYLAEASIVDGFLGRLREEIHGLGLEDRAVIILAADHGEAFGEHQTYFHAVSVYEELLRVPLLIRAPGVAPRRVDAPVTLMDIGPTVLDLFGQTTPGSYMGQSLVPFLRGQSPALARPIAAETGRLQRTLIFPDGFKVIEDLYRNTVEAYDLVKDPGETNNLIDGADSRSEVRLRETRAFFERNAYHALGYHPPYRP
jgi:hypothetical protein